MSNDESIKVQNLRRKIRDLEEQALRLRQQIASAEDSHRRATEGMRREIETRLACPVCDRCEDHGTNRPIAVA